MELNEGNRTRPNCTVESCMEKPRNYIEGLRNLKNCNEGNLKSSSPKGDNELVMNNFNTDSEHGSVLSFESELIKNRPTEENIVIMKKEYIDPEEAQSCDGPAKFDEFQVKKEPADINPLEFCDVKMDINEENEEAVQQSYSSQKVALSGRRKELTEAERRQIVDFHNAGEGYKKIASRLATNRSTVRNILMKWKQHHTVATLPRNGRKCKPKKFSLPATGDVTPRKERRREDSSTFVFIQDLMRNEKNRGNKNLRGAHIWRPEQAKSANGRLGRESGELNPSSSLNNPYDPKKMVRCPECNNLFTKNYIKVHVLNHSKEIFECSKCSYSTNRKERLELHELNHLETKTFQCGQCAYATNIQKYFKEHVKIHTDRKVFTCSKCDYQTNIKKYLREHIMIHTEKKLFKCSKCYYETNRKDRLRIHEQNHSEVKRFHCGHCDFGTNIKRVLKDHELTHLEATMFHCNQCEYTTNFKSSLNRHTRTHCKKKTLGTG